MAHSDDCETCLRLEGNTVEVQLQQTDDPHSRRFVAHPWPVQTELRFTRSSEAAQHPIARALWRAGTAEVVLDEHGATVTRHDPRAWPMYGEDIAVSLREQLALLD